MNNKLNKFVHFTSNNPTTQTSENNATTPNSTFKTISILSFSAHKKIVYKTTYTANFVNED